MRALFAVALLASGCWPTQPSEPVEQPFDAGNLGDPVWDAGVFSVWSSDGAGERNQPSEVFPLIHGPQGGYHVYLGFSVTGAPALNAEVRFEVTATRVRDDKQIAGTVVVQDVVTNSSGNWTYSPFLVRLCPTPVGVNIIGEPLRFQVRALRTNVAFLGSTSATTTLSCQNCQSDCGG